MTREQRLLELRKALAIDERFTKLLTEAAEDYINAALRKTMHSNEPAILIRQAGMAEGVEGFIKEITKDPVAAR